MKKQLVTLPVGYNGHVATLYAEPIETDGHCVKLGCAEPGREYLFGWFRASDVQAAVLAQK